jgi:hypothetical protein
MFNLNKILLALYKSYKQDEAMDLAYFSAKAKISATVYLLFLLLYYILNKLSVLPMLHLPNNRWITGVLLALPIFYLVNAITYNKIELEEKLTSLTDKEESSAKLFFNIVTGGIAITFVILLTKFGGLQ